MKAVAAIAFGAIAAPASAQQSAPRTDTPASAIAQSPAPVQPRTPDSRWEIEFYRGFGPVETRVSSGSGSLPGAGEGFTTNGGVPSRYVTSWFFGDGASLLNDVLQANGRNERITPLDSVLTGGVAAHTTEPGFGVRVVRQITRRYRLEVAVENAPGDISLLPEAIADMQAVRQSFTSAFAGLVAAGQGVVFTDPALSSELTVGFTPVTGSDWLVTGALILGGGRGGFLRPFVTAGGGVVKAGGEVTATISSRYAFTLPGGGRVDERDSVTMRFAGGLGFVGLVGGGAKVHLTRLSGVRVEGRVHFVQHHIHTRVDTHPEVTASLPADAIWSTTAPGIQFVTNPSTGLRSNLSAPALSGERTMRGSGLQSRASLSIGYFFKF